MKKKVVETPNLPLCFKRLDAFLDGVKVKPAQAGELDLARKALDEIIQVLYGPEGIQCTGLIPSISG